MCLAISIYQYQCSCFNGYSGQNCQISPSTVSTTTAQNINPCQNSPCLNGGFCTAVNNIQYTCILILSLFYFKIRFFYFLILNGVKANALMVLVEQIAKLLQQTHQLPQHRHNHRIHVNPILAITVECVHAHLRIQILFANVQVNNLCEFSGFVSVKYCMKKNQNALYTLIYLNLLILLIWIKYSKKQI